MKKIILICITTIVSQSFGLPASKATIRVLDSETNEPISGARVQRSYSIKTNWNERDEYQESSDVSDKNGFAILEGKEMGIDGHKARANLTGYYESRYRSPYSGKTMFPSRWEPWNPTIDVFLRKIKDPVPMIFKRVESLDIPKWDENIGFDLEKGDWVYPHGSGEISDLKINMFRQFTSPNDYNAICNITFNNQGDGFFNFLIPNKYHNSSFQFPYQAPLDNYFSNLKLERHSENGRDSCNFDKQKTKYIFRVRTKLDRKGNIISALYGRIDDLIEIAWGDVIDFRYYLNPDPNSRSLEYNGTNLLKK